jgi:hypothetical protein
MLNRLVEKKKCLLDQETLDASNIAKWEQFSDSGYVVFYLVFVYVFCTQAFVLHVIH